VAVGVIKATTPKEAAGVTTKAAQKVIFFLSSCDAVLLVHLLVLRIHDILVQIQMTYEIGSYSFIFIQNKFYLH
jgi:hypothetical protein